MMEHVLGAGAVVTVVVDVLAPAPNTYTIRRAADERPRITDAAGDPVAFHPLDVVDDVEIFGQHELAELAHDPVEVARMLARFAGQENKDVALQQTERELADNRAALQIAEKELASLETQLEELPRLEAQKTRYDESGTATRLRVVDELNADEQRFANAKVLVSDVRNAIRVLSSEALYDRIAAHEPVADDRPALTAHRTVEKALKQLADKIAEGVREISEAAVAAEKAIEAQQTVWQQETREVREETQAVLRKLHDEGLEPKKYLDASKAIATLDQRATQRAALRDKREDLLRERDELMGDLGGHRARLRTGFLDSVRRATSAANGDVIVQAARNLDRDAYITVLDAHVGGQRNQIRAALEAETFVAADFVVAARTARDTLAGTYGLSDAQARKVIDAGEPFLRELEEVTLPDAVMVKLNVASEGGPREYRALDELSRGQKATALLLLLLSASKTPLIIDQPEDDLDNRFIYRGIVRRLRELKGERQIIVTTHNANIPILGDAELLIALESGNARGRPIQDGVGSIDSAGVRRVAEDILEGGHDAFTQRRQRYGY